MSQEISTRWVPRLLTVENKRTRVFDAAATSERFVAIMAKFLLQYLLLINYGSTATLKRQNNSRNSGFKKVKSAGKVMATTYLQARGIILNSYLEKGRTICNICMGPLELRNKKITSTFGQEESAFHHDNVSEQFR